jgi:hypothetical protein
VLITLLQVVIAGTADGAVAIVERDQEGTLKRGRTFRLPQVASLAQIQTPCAVSCYHVNS